MWFKKKEAQVSNIPDLPDLPELPEVPSLEPAPKSAPKQFTKEESSLPSLPSFPVSETANRMTQESIKSALTLDSKSKYTREIGSPGQQEKEVTFKTVRDPIPLVPKKFAIPQTRPNMPVQEHEMQKSPIFVRIDKFQLALKNLHEIRKQVADVEDYLSEIREIKAKEEAELAEWESHMLDIKAKLESLDTSVFSKLD